MNEVEILSSYVSRRRGMKKINGVLTPVFLKPYDKKYNYTKRFIDFNNTLLRQGLTNTIVYDDKLIYNRQFNTFENKSKYYKRKRLRPNQQPYLRFEDNAVFVAPAIQQLNSEGAHFTYRNSFKQQAGTPYHSVVFRFKQILRNYLGRTILIKGYLEGLYDREHTLQIPNTLKDFKRWYNENKIWTILEVASGEYIFDYQLNNNVNTGRDLPEQQQGRMRIFIMNNVNPQRYTQAFADGVGHCVLSPIRKYLDFRIENCKNPETSTMLKYNAALKKITLWDKKYPSSIGIPLEELQTLCDETKFGIDLYLVNSLIKERKWREFRPPKQPTKIFKFINTRNNHLDIAGQIGNQFRIKVKTREELDDLKCELYGDDSHFIYNNYCIIGLDKIYCLEDEYSEIVSKFEKRNQLKRFRLDATNTKSQLLHKFVDDSCIYNGCIDFKDTHKYRMPNVENEEDLWKTEKYFGKEILKTIWKTKKINEKIMKIINNNIEEDNIKQIDMSKAYTRCAFAPYFDGYLGKITDFRRTTKIRALGLYCIKNINYDNCFYANHLKKLQFLFENNIYPSPELKYLKSLGVKFDIVAGCWGSKINIDWGDEKDEYDCYTGMFKRSGETYDYTPPRNYVKWFGCAIKKTPYTSYTYSTNNEEYISNWAYELEEDDKYDPENPVGLSYYERLNGVYDVKMNIPKKNIYHHSQIASFIYSYQRIMMIEQLTKIPLDNIVRVCVDGIYYNDCEFIKTKYFTDDDSYKFSNYPTDKYRTKDIEWINFTELGEDKEYSRKEVWTGPGGCGKTYNNIIDKGNCDVLYVAHSWKLSAAKRDEFVGLDVSVVARLTMEDWYVNGVKTNYWEELANKYSTIVIDEISTLSNVNKMIIEGRFNHHKLIFCGDIGKNRLGQCITYQCPPIFTEGEGGSLFKFGKGYKHYHLDVNRRCECPKLEKLLKLLRRMIYDGFDERKLIHWVRNNFDIIDKNLIVYEPRDMILGRTHKFNEFYDEKYKDLEKYYIKEKEYKQGKTIYNGEIFLEKPDIPEGKYKIRHGYTIDCIQGETAYHKLFIDTNRLTSLNHLYTAISRAKRFKQIQFVK